MEWSKDPLELIVGHLAFAMANSVLPDTEDQNRPGSFWAEEVNYRGSAFCLIVNKVTSFLVPGKTALIEVDEADSLALAKCCFVLMGMWSFNRSSIKKKKKELIFVMNSQYWGRRRSVWAFITGRALEACHVTSVEICWWISSTRDIIGSKKKKFVKLTFWTPITKSPKQLFRIFFNF